MSELPTSHRSHDYLRLIKRWQALAKKTGLTFNSFVEVNELPVYYFSTASGAEDEREVIYLSAGIHGDEPAPPWGLLEWAEANKKLLKSQRFLIFPTLNPHGIILNTRADHRGVDLNRAFNQEADPLIVAWKEVVKGLKFSLALCLHEDYDGQGCYLYELAPRGDAVGHDLLNDCASVIPPDLRKNIDGRAAKTGLILRRRIPELPGYPEAIVLQRQGCPKVFTFESPSEFSLQDRIAVQHVFVAAALKRVLGIS